MIHENWLQDDDSYQGIATVTRHHSAKLGCRKTETELENTHMKATRLLDEIRETNLSYLLLAQQLIREDRAEATFRLGISEEVADLIDQLTTAQVLRIASSNMLMCRFRFDDEVVWNLLTSHTKDRSVSGMHAAIIMSGKAVNAAA